MSTSWLRNSAGIGAACENNHRILSARLGPYKLGVTQGYISELESGQKNPTLLTLTAIAEELEVKIVDLVSKRS